jgi:hypothetical protein
MGCHSLATRVVSLRLCALLVAAVNVVGMNSTISRTQAHYLHHPCLRSRKIAPHVVAVGRIGLVVPFGRLRLLLLHVLVRVFVRCLVRFLFLAR